MIDSSHENSAEGTAATNHRSRSIRAVVLDFGLVLCNAPSDAHIERVSKIFGIDHATFWRLYDRNRLALDRGDMSSDDYWTAFALGAGHSGTLDADTLENLKRWDIEMWLTLNDPMLDWAERLNAAGYKLGLLSNLHKSFANHLREHAGWLRHFHTHVFSAELGRVKPEPEIYQHLLKQLSTPADQTLFIDDRQLNINAARREGVQSLLYTSVPQLRTDLRALSFEPLP
ncbi:MAG: HAD family phosphatase [Candidatus Acidiferrales bacterium]